MESCGYFSILNILFVCRHIIKYVLIYLSFCARKLKYLLRLRLLFVSLQAIVAIRRALAYVGVA